MPWSSPSHPYLTLSLPIHTLYMHRMSIPNSYHGLKQFAHHLFVTMSMREKLPLLVLLILCFVSVFATLASAKEDPELKQCRHQCRAQREFDPRQRQECEDDCERYYRERKRREKEEEGRRGGDEEFWNPEGLVQKLLECQSRCVQKEQQEERRRDCQRRCLDEFKREQEEHHGGGGDLLVENKRDHEEFWNPEGPVQKLAECQSRCVQKEHQEERRKDCPRRCLEEFKREQEKHRGGGGDLLVENKRDPEKQFRRCKEGCKREWEGHQEQLQQCEERCDREYREHQKDGEDDPTYEGREEERESEGQQQGKPYVFEDQHFTTRLDTAHGKVKVLQKFTERSKLFRGIENYRVAILEADPQTFIVPNHWDAEAVVFVAKGRGSISLVRHDKRESFNLKCGDVLRVPAGVTVYLINRSNNEKLILVKLLQPVSIPGHFEAFFGPGGEDPESYYKAFSTELLEAALNTRRDRIEKLFGQQRQGVFIKASEEQIRGMSHHEEGGIWPFGESKGPFNLFQKRAPESNQYGQLYEVDPSDCTHLEELDLGVGFANISEGAMITPYYNSRATKIAIVTNGEGFFEMACPHLASSEFGGHGGSEGRQPGGGGSRRQGKTGPSYHKVRAPLRRGVVYVVPAGHPVIAVASNNQNLEILCFDIHARNNEKMLLAGRRNIINHLEREAKELSFGVPSREVDEVFKSQDDEFFLKGPRQQRRHEGRADA